MLMPNHRFEKEKNDKNEMIGYGNVEFSVGYPEDGENLFVYVDEKGNVVKKGIDIFIFSFRRRVVFRQ